MLTREDEKKKEGKQNAVTEARQSWCSASFCSSCQLDKFIKSVLLRPSSDAAPVELPSDRSDERTVTLLTLD